MKNVISSQMELYQVQPEVYKNINEKGNHIKSY